MSGSAPVAPDQAIRDEALTPDRSFLVQAPAGAGKTALLVQRFLRLLATVEEPEQILAITFTRKAAAEMRQRLVDALAGEADALAVPGTARLIDAVRVHDAQRGWNLPAHPARLRIMTIDALNAAIARSLPVGSGAAACRNVVEAQASIYLDAASETLALLGTDSPIAAALRCLYVHFGNQLDVLREQLAMMLKCRDQWLPLIGTGPADDEQAARLRMLLEGALAGVVRAHIHAVERSLPATLQAGIERALAPAAAARGVAAGRPVPEDDLAPRLAWWRFVADILLIKDGRWRTRFTVTQGFSPSDKPAKARIEALAATLREAPHDPSPLAAVARLPEPVYRDAQWEILAALLRILPVAAAHLDLIAAARGETDHVGIARAALAALGDDEAPGELAQRLDWRLHHLLVDEFQDTSRAQYHLLQALTRGWQAGDGRTLFMVGDPMQSIYRFRQADVRIFLDMRDHGLPGVVLEFLRLEANFRSRPAIVEWINEIFANVMSPHDDALVGTVAYTPSRAVKAAVPGSGVFLHCMPDADPLYEAREVVGIVRSELAADADRKIAILVRSRSHAAGVLSALRDAGIPCTSELLQLGQTGTACDLLAITRALIHPADRLAWLALLRAPWCGLSLGELESLAGSDPHATIEQCLADRGAGDALSEASRQRVARLVAAMAAARAQLGHVGLRDIVEALWVQLGGPAVTGDAEADAVLAHLAAQERGGDLPDVLAVMEALAAQPAPPGHARQRVQIMTMHKAKGLEFDTVILPGLGRETRPDKPPVLLWQEMPVAGGRDTLLLAPVNASGEEKAPLYEMLRSMKAAMDVAERDRLLYVAATRARMRLHLIGHLAAVTRGSERAAPRARSLLARLWPALAHLWPAPPDGAPDADPPHDGAWLTPPRNRFGDDWRLPAMPPAWQPRGAIVSGAAPPPYDWASRWAMHAGAVAHRWLQHIAQQGIERFPAARLAVFGPTILRQLAEAGVAGADLERARQRVLATLANCIADRHGAWVLSAMHEDSRSEYALTAVIDGRCRRLVVDRCFIDGAGVRWIIDYKTAIHEGTDLETFFANEIERHGPQLRLYEVAFRRLEPRPCRVALYYPLHRRLLVLGEGVASASPDLT